MADLPLLFDKCQRCGYKWRASDVGHLDSCPSCGSTNISAARPKQWMALGVAALAILAVFGMTHSGSHPASSQAAAPASSQAASSVSTYVVPINTGAQEAPANAGAAAAGGSVASAAPNSGAGNGGPRTVAESGKTHAGSSEASEGAPASQFPSLDCGAANTKVSRKICASDNLQKMDEALAALYEVASQSGANKHALAADQDQWQRNVRDACDSEQCLNAAYNARAEALANMAAGGQ